LRILAVTTIDLIITDWNIPGMSGLQLVQAIRSIEATKAIPVLMVTINDSEDQEVLAALKVEVTAYVVKPFNANVMTERIYSLLHPHDVTRSIRG
jgi:two-component system chemotaxis response regulator CheY